MAEKTKLFFVQDSDQDNSNGDGSGDKDLIVEAVSWIQAAALWQQYYKEELEDKPNSQCDIWELPPRQNKPAAYAWRKYADHAYCPNIWENITPITS